jgi:lipopolysaccharide export system protein LptC
MSEIAEIERSKRRIWARPGSSHDYLIKTLRIILPAAAGVLAAFLITAPITGNKGDVSFVLAKDSVDIAKERMRVIEAVYRGEDNKGRAFLLRAGSAVQKTSREPIVRIKNFDAKMQMSDGPATVRADNGRYDMGSKIVSIDGPMSLESSGGYRMSTRDVTVDLNDRAMTSGGAVDGQMPLGTFAADQLRVDMESRTVTLNGRARLRITQGIGR